MLAAPTLEMWKRLLVPHDFSDCAAHALDLAVRLAHLSGAALTLLHVSPLVPVVTVRTPSPESKLTGEESRAEDELAG